MGENPFESEDLALRVVADIARLRAEILEWCAEPTDVEYQAKVTEWLVETLDIHARIWLEVVDREALLPEYVERVRFAGLRLLERESQPGRNLANPYSEKRLRDIAESSGFLADRGHLMSSEERERWIENEIERARVVLRDKIESATTSPQQLCFRVETRFEARYSHWKAEAIEQIRRARANADLACSQPPNKEAATQKQETRTVIARNIELLREECGWSQDELAHASGIDKTQIVDHLKCRATPRPNTLRVYADTFAARLRRAVTVADLKN